MMTSNTHRSSSKKTPQKTEQSKGFWIEWAAPDGRTDDYVASSKGHAREGAEGKEHYYCDWN